MFNDLGNEYLIFLLGVLFVEDTIRFIAKTNASEEMRRRVAIFAII